MLFKGLQRLFGNNACIYYSQNTYQSSDSCGEKERISCTSQCSSSCPCDLGGYDICRLCWLPVCSEQCPDSACFSNEECDPVSVSAAFLNSPCVPCDFRGRPAYLKCKKCVGDKLYVLLGVSCVGDVAFELNNCQICRVSFICK